MAAYRIDVLDPRVTPRRIAVLADRLPPWAISPGEAWSTESELLAVVIDHLAQLTYYTLKANGARSVQRPRPLPRPQRRRVRPPGTATAPQGRTSAPAAGGKSASWLDAAAQLAAIPGVITVTEDGADG